VCSALVKAVPGSPSTPKCWCVYSCVLMHSCCFIISTRDTGILELQHVPSQTGAGSFPSCSRPRVQGCRGRRHQRSSVRSTQAVQNMNFLPKVPLETNCQVSLFLIPIFDSNLLSLLRLRRRALSPLTRISGRNSEPFAAEFHLCMSPASR
jgi:hypothetical protein